MYVAAAGQPGPRYTGHSMLVAPDGDVVVELGSEDDGAAASGRLDRAVLEAVRSTNPSLQNRRL